MPSMALDKVIIDDSRKKVIAKEDLPKGFNLGPVFLVKGKTGDYKLDFIRTQLGQYMRQNQFRYNATIKQRQYKIYAVTTQKIKAGEEIIIDQFPWMLPTYNPKSEM